jgi:hypothetical protein
MEDLFELFLKEKRYLADVTGNPCCSTKAAIAPANARLKAKSANNPLTGYSLCLSRVGAEDTREDQAE